MRWPSSASSEAEQNRDWFAENKERYDLAVAAPLASLVMSLSLAMAANELPLTGEPKSSIFRIHRDVRFSKDKRPYKTTASFVLTRDGTKKSRGCFTSSRAP